MTSSEQSKTKVQYLVDLLRYKAWANAITLGVVASLPEAEALKQRATRFGSIVHTLNHIWVVEDIFRHHVTGRRHDYTARNTPAPPPLAELRSRFQEMDSWWISYAQSLRAEECDEMVCFTFVGGGDGAMTRAEILLHLVNHASYHRGFVGDMLYQAGVTPPATDLPVYLRETRKPPAGCGGEP